MVDIINNLNKDSIFIKDILSFIKIKIIKDNVCASNNNQINGMFEHSTNNKVEMKKMKKSILFLIVWFKKREVIHKNKKVKKSILFI